MLVGLMFCLFGACCDDPYSKNVVLEVPVSTEAANLDSIRVGDSIIYRIDMPKEVALYESDQKVRLDNFKFGLEFTLTEISDTTERWGNDAEINASVGHLDTLGLSGGLITYPISLEETEETYRLVLKLIVQEPGLYVTAINADPVAFRSQNHPFLETCADKERRDVRVQIINNVTSEYQFENFYRMTPIVYLQELVDYDRYASGGSHTFIVTE